MYAHGSLEDRKLQPWLYATAPRARAGVGDLGSGIPAITSLAIGVGILVLAGVGAYVLIKKR